ncbi:hypothetical protein CR164_02925 [Prosthecochloris marina]|uniref:Uncharacterized protein n=1 Tax=Prosthecochloris marina TaxID=2017681 RepID=A0A317T7R4_9CHLB|nr:hypothetical protein CR164_02925 [Prosthecochloris marina]
MNMNCHACAIDVNSTAIASVTYDEDGGYSIRECKTIRTGTSAYNGTGGDKALGKLASFLRKKQIETVVLSIHTPCFFPLDTVFPKNISDTTFDSHCRAEAGFLLSKPGEYMHDNIPYTLNLQQQPVRKHLVFYYPDALFGIVRHRLRAFCSISNATLYLKPIIRSVAATFQPFVLLEIEHEYATFSAGSNGELEHFSYWRLNHQNDAEYFVLRELMTNPQYKQRPIYITGNLALDKPLAEQISDAAGTTLSPLNLVNLYAMENNVRSSCSLPIELKALSAAFINLYDKKTS